MAVLIVRVLLGFDWILPRAGAAAHGCHRDRRGGFDKCL
jgi:hypothetical protein